MWLKFIVTFLLFSSCLSECCKNYKLYDVTARNEDQQTVLKNLSEDQRIDFLNLKRLHNVTTRVLVPPEQHFSFVSTLQSAGIDFVLINSDVSKVTEGNAKTSPRAVRDSSELIDFSTYKTHEEINAYLEKLEKAFPRRVFVKPVGKSYEKRFMKTITVTNGDGRGNKKVILLDAGIHAREWIAPAAALYVIHQLVEKFEENKHLLEDYDWVILPSVNPDGYTHSRTENRMWRKTRKPYTTSANKICFGADPNRNFGYYWGGLGTSNDPCTDIYHGPVPFSENESQVLRDIILTYKNRCNFYLTLHSYGKYLLYPWGYAQDPPHNVDDLEEVAQAGYNAMFEATGTKYTVGSSSVVLYEAAGASDDYAYSNGIPISITMELPAGGLLGFFPAEKNIDPYVKETWVGIKAMASKVIEKY